MKKILLILLFAVSVYPQVINRPNRIEILTGGGSGSETGEIFADDFEDGTFDAWDIKTTEGDNTITADTDTVNAGTYSAKYWWAGTDNWNYLEIAVSNVETIYFRGYGYANKLAGNNYINLFSIEYWDGSSAVARVFFRNSGGGVWNRYVIAANGYSDTYSTENDSIHYHEWMRFEFGWEKGTGSDGFATFKVNGAELITNTSIDHTAFSVDKIRLGTYGGAVYDSSSTFYWDDIVIDSTGWVGAKP